MEKGGKKGKNKTLVRVGVMDLRKYPHFLQDGDILGVRVAADDPEGTDDFQTEEDRQLKVDFAMKKAQRDEDRKR